jgi:hypothetical protein
MHKPGSAALKACYANCSSSGGAVPVGPSPKSTPKKEDDLDVR